MLNNSDHAFAFIPLPVATQKPRKTSITYVRGPNVLGQYMNDFIETAAPWIDVLKIGSHNARLMPRSGLERTIRAATEHGIDVAIGNPIIDSALMLGPKAVVQTVGECQRLGIAAVEVSGFAKIMAHEDRVALIRFLVESGIKVIAEVGIAFAGIVAADNADAGILNLSRQIDAFQEAGAWWILIESEGITENVASDGLRWDIVESLTARHGAENLVFEADDDEVLATYIKKFGPRVNVMVDHSRVLQLQQARNGLGLRHYLWGRVAAFSAPEANS